MSTRDKLTFIQEESDLQALCRLHPAALKGELVCFETALHHRLDEQGVEHHRVSDFVTQEHHAAVEAVYQRLTDTWDTFLVPPIEYRRIDPFRLSRARHLACLRRAAYAMLAVRRTLDELQPREVVGFVEPGVQDVEPVEPPAGGANGRLPLVQGIARLEAQRRRIGYLRLDRSCVPGHVPWADLQGSKQVACGRDGPCRPFRRVASKPLVIAAGNESDLVAQQPVVAELRRRGRTQVLHLGGVVDSRTRSWLAKQGHDVRELADIGVPLSSPPTEALTRQARQRRERRLYDLPDDVRLFFDNPHIQSHFDYLLGAYLGEMLLQIERWTRLFDLWRPDLLVVNEDLPMAGIARAWDIPVLEMTPDLPFPGSPERLADRIERIVTSPAPAAAPESKPAMSPSRSERIEPALADCLPASL